MHYSKFLQMVSREPELNPFHRMFSKKKFAETYSDLDERNSGRAKALMAFVLLIHKEFAPYLELADSVVLDTTKRLQFFLNAIELVNHDSIVANQKVNGYFETSKTFHTLQQFAMTITAGGEEQDLGAMMDTTLDTFDFIRRRLETAALKEMTLPQVTEVGGPTQQRFMEFFLFSNFYQAHESLFQMVCFDGSEFAIGDRGITITSPALDLDLLKRISNVRIANNLSINLRRAISDQRLRKFLTDGYFKGRKFLSYVKVSANDGYIEPILGVQDVPEVLRATLVTYHSVCISYFYHLSKDSLAKIIQVGEVFSVLQNFTSVAIEYFTRQRSETEEAGVDPNYFQLKVRAPDLYGLISGATSLSMPQITESLSLFLNDGRDSSWERPLFRFGNDFYVILHGFHNAHALNLIDFWCKTKKIEFDEKGSLFERYVKDQIGTYCRRRSFFSKISPINKFRCESGEEEIDLVWETKNTVLIAEIKCLRYPFDSRKYYDFKKVAISAVDQVKRKRQFLEDNQGHFPEIALDKQIAVCVITNYSALTGATIEDVPILDFGILGQYIDMGYIASAMSEGGIEREHIESKLYENEDEFSLRLPEVLLRLPMLEKFKRLFRKSTRDIPFIGSLRLTIEEYEFIPERFDLNRATAVQH